MNNTGMIEPPKSLLKALNVPKKLLMGPGPSNCSPRVLHSLSQQVIGHLHQECLQIMDEIKEGLQYVFQTRNRLTLAISASGHSGMEAVMCNLIEPGDIVLVAVSGIWGERAADMAARYGAVVHKIEKPLGESFSVSEIEEALRKFHPSLFFVVQGESSTGVFQRCCQLGPLCHKYGCLLAVDTVASLGGVQFYADQWEIDVVYTGSQKVLGAPPGLAPISFSPRAEYGLEISGGLGPTVGKIIRIGLMGYNATPENVSLTLAVLKEALAHATASRL